MSVNTIQTAAVIQSELDKAAVEQATSGWMEVNSNLDIMVDQRSRSRSFLWTVWLIMTARTVL